MFWTSRRHLARHLPDKTRHTDNRIPGGIRTRNPSQRATVVPPLRLRGLANLRQGACNNACVLRTFSSFHCLKQRALHAAETTNSIPGAVDGVCFHNGVRLGLAVEGWKDVFYVTSVSGPCLYIRSTDVTASEVSDYVIHSRCD